MFEIDKLKLRARILGREPDLGMCDVTERR